jgi:hypothetical protein
MESDVTHFMRFHGIGKFRIVKILDLHFMSRVVHVEGKDGDDYHGKPEGGHFLIHTQHLLCLADFLYHFLNLP